MNEQDAWFNKNGGLKWCTSRTSESSNAIYDWAEASTFATPYVLDKAKRSGVVATVNFDDAIDALEIAKILRANGIVDTDPYRKLGKNQLRIAIFPALDPDDVKKLISCIEYVVAELTK